MNNIKTIYLDNAATTKMEPDVIHRMKECFDVYYNPSSIYAGGEYAKNLISESRDHVARLINSDPEEIFFTSGGTEADNWAIISTYLSLKDRGNHVITSKVEHHAVLGTCKFMEKYLGADVTYLDVDKYGMIDLNKLEESVTERTILISIMSVNNEIGNIYPIKEMSAIAHKHNVLFHTDAVQATGHIPLDMNDELCNVDMMSVSAHKLGGPKGVGCLYIRSGLEMIPYIHGGMQERGLRASTENVLGIIGFGEAARIAKENMESRNKYIIGLRDYLQDRIIKSIPNVVVNGNIINRSVNNLSITFKGIRAESLLILLSDNGIYISTGSACNSSSNEASHVLRAIGLSDEDSSATIRFSLSHENTKEEIDYVIDVLIRSVEQLRRFSNEDND